LARYIDLSYPLEPATPIFANYLPVEITILDFTGNRETRNPRAVNSSRLAIGLHCGTHMDAPFHFYGDGQTIDRVPLERCIGPATLVRLLEHGAHALITPADLSPYEVSLRETGKAILHTGWDRRWGDAAFFTDHPVITREAAQLLVACGVHLVGVDFPSVDVPPYETHLELLGHGLLIVENLTRLEEVRATSFHFTALPLRIVGRDGSPVRAIAME
jgi:kynurenine formamidase